MVKGNYTAIIVSVIIHLLLLLTLIYSSIKTPSTLKKVHKNQGTAIKSFLYVRPKKPTNKAISQPHKIISKQLVQQADKVAESVKSMASVAVKPQIKGTIQAHEKPPRKHVKSASTLGKPVKIPTVNKFSSLSNLSHLRAKLDQQNRFQAFNETTKQRSASLMDGEQIAVPKTIVPLTKDQQKKQNTSGSHYSSITKNGDGTCTIHREQMLGSPVLASTSVFACGESDFDRSFRLHMQAVQSKLSIKKH